MLATSRARACDMCTQGDLASQLAMAVCRDRRAPVLVLLPIRVSLLTCRTCTTGVHAACRAIKCVLWIIVPLAPQTGVSHDMSVQIYSRRRTDGLGRRLTPAITVLASRVGTCC